MKGSSRTIATQLAQKATSQLEQDEARKLSGKLSDTFNYMYSHIKKPSIRIETFKQMGEKRTITNPRNIKKFTRKEA